MPEALENPPAIAPARCTEERGPTKETHETAETKVVLRLNAATSLCRFQRLHQLLRGPLTNVCSDMKIGPVESTGRKSTLLIRRMRAMELREREGAKYASALAISPRFA